MKVGMHCAQESNGFSLYRALSTHLKKFGCRRYEMS
jgi:hypothetical protein